VTDKKYLNVRLPAVLLDAIDAVGKEKYPADNPNGCDRTSTVLEVLTLGLKALGKKVELEERKPKRKAGDKELVEAISQLQKQIQMMEARWEERTAEMEARLGKLKA
jgi:hypothetical protein